MNLDLNSRLTLIVIACLVGLLLEAGIAATGGQANTALISAFSSIILAVIALGASSKNGNGKNGNSNGNGK